MLPFFQNFGQVMAILCLKPFRRFLNMFYMTQTNVDSSYFCSDPLEGGGTIYSNGFFLFREFSPIEIFIVES